MANVQLLTSWALLTGITIEPGVAVRSTGDTGLGVVYDGPGIAATDGEPSPFITVPADMIINSENIQRMARSQPRLAALLATAIDAYEPMPGEDAAAESRPLLDREIICRFLVYSMHDFKADKHQHEQQGNIFRQFLAFYPREGVLTPTTWTEPERLLLAATSIFRAVDAKRNKLESEFLAFEKVFSRVYPGESMTLHEYLLADFYISSRAMEMPSSTDRKVGLVPLVDFANHRAHVETNCKYEYLADGSIALVSVGRAVAAGDELVISYGDDKGAGEMLFSYGFVPAIETDDGFVADGALKLRIVPELEEDRAKEYLLGKPAVLEIRQDGASRTVEWTCDYLWLAIVGRRDGLELELVELVTGEDELRLSYNGRVVDTRAERWLDGLKQQMHDRTDTVADRTIGMWPVYYVRACVRVLELIEHTLEVPRVESDECRPAVVAVAEQCIAIETKVLRQAQATVRSQMETMYEAHRADIEWYMKHA
ncbi:uncharacterized protein V1510DRAFT_415785 [Dipodascopsis tothii]|uniref:uncharacterized protein n=1 Tax=Dipodascopsis tothii TaxID=44089 RepID=UPI0034CFEB4F